jgi:Spy/CpxP family protein refolding chaperone
MKANKLIALCAAAVLASGTFAGAQTPDAAGPEGWHHHGPPNITEMLTHALNLTDAQKAQVQAKVAAVQPQLDAIREQARKQADVIINQLHEQIRPLLTAEQQKRLDAIQTLRDTRPDGAGPE